MQGFNMGRYHPPGSLDKSLSSDKDNGSKRRQTAKGQQVVRFEMPFAIWCTTCNPEEIIGQGVRFNAQKKRVGNYHTTPIWSFEMRHGQCGGIIEIRTDPVIGDYTVENGGRRRDYGEAVSLSEIGVDRERKDGGDPFAGVEGRTEMGIKTRSANQIIERLQHDNERKWDDPFTVNQRLRKSFRVERKQLEKKQEEREEIAERLGLSIDILDNTEEDERRAAHVYFGTGKDGARESVISSQARPLFEDPRLKLMKSSKSKEKSSAATKQDLQRRLQHSSRASQDPFLSKGEKNLESAIKIVGIKRKRTAEDGSSTPSNTAEPHIKQDEAQPPTIPASLVTYDSENNSEDESGS